MKLNTVLARIPLWYASGKCVYLKGPSGRGKTDTLTSAAALLSKQLAKKMGMVVINGGLLNPPDAIGYLVPRKVTIDGVDHMESIYTDPFWFLTLEGFRLTDYDGGIILIDEADKMDVDVKKVIGEAALSGRLGPHILPKGWVIWMAGNRMKDRSGSTKELDHLINRRMEIEVEDDIESWNDWANANDVPPLYKAFANQNIHIVFTDGVPEKQGPWCTPRSLVEASRFHRLASGDAETLDDSSVVLEEIAGMIGDAAAQQLFSFVRLEKEMPRFEDIVASPQGCRIPDRPDAMMLVCYNLAHRVDRTTANSVIAYINRLPKEFGVIFGRAATKRDAMLLTTQGFIDWIKVNASLMAAIGGR